MANAHIDQTFQCDMPPPRPDRSVNLADPGANVRIGPLVWWFGSSLHFCRESAKRTSEPKPHQNHMFLVSFRIRSSQMHPLQEGANFGFGTLGRMRQFSIRAGLIDRERQLMRKNLRDLVDRNMILRGELSNGVAAEYLLQLIRRDGQVLAR